MIGPLGHGFILLSVLLAASGAVLSFVGGKTGRRAMTTVAGDLAIAMFALVAGAVLLMEYALIRHDFSIQYVAQVGSHSTPLFFTIISLWSALEGSILLWALILATYTIALVRWGRKREGGDPVVAYTLGTLLCVNVFFLLVIAGPANPFGVLDPAPTDGPGPNPLLQNHPLMAVHPPLLYSGYVGMAVPFAFAVGGLVRGGIDRDWGATVRTWTMVPWTFLTLGIIAGAWWSYEVLGWGGYWAWDPVENASFLPWLTATAFLHSFMVQERRNTLHLWTMSLILATFALTLLGTFLTRSGVIASVHAFTQSGIGPYFLGFLGLVAIASVAFLAWRAERFRTEGRLESVLSRETVILINNFLLVTFTFVVLFGTIFPLLAELLRGTKVTVGEPFFDQMTAPLALGLIVLIGVGPALPWGAGSVAAIRRKFLWPGVAALGAGAILLVAGVRAPLAWLAFVATVLSYGLIATDLLEPARARRRAHRETWPRALARACLGNRRRFGGYIVHAGVLLIALGITGSSSFRQQAEWTIEQGESEGLGRYAIQFDSLWAVQEPQRDGVVAGITVYANGEVLERMYPRMNYYRSATEPVGTPAVHEGIREDLYLVLMAYPPDGSSVTLQAIVSPLVTWIWAGGVIMGVGALIGLWPGRRPRRDAPAPGPPGRPKPRRKEQPVLIHPAGTRP